MNCAHVQAEEVIERYVLDQLSEDDRDAFEKHYFDCEECFDRVRTISDLQAELRRSASTIRREPARSRSAVPWVLAAAAGILLAAGVGLWYAVRPVEQTPPATASVLQPAIPRTADQPSSAAPAGVHRALFPQPSPQAFHDIRSRDCSLQGGQKSRQPRFEQSFLPREMRQHAGFSSVSHQVIKSS